MNRPLMFTSGIPPSTNTAYFNVPGRGRVLSEAARTFKELAIYNCLRAAKKQDWHYVPDTPLQLKLVLHFNHNGKRDLSNRIKLIEDALAQALGFDDKMIHRLIVERGPNTKAAEFCIVRLEELLLQTAL